MTVYGFVDFRRLSWTYSLPETELPAGSDAEGFLSDQ